MSAEVISQPTHISQKMSEQVRGKDGLDLFFFIFDKGMLNPSNLNGHRSYSQLWATSHPKTFYTESLTASCCAPCCALLIRIMADGAWSDAEMQQALRESMESASVRFGTPLSPQAGNGRWPAKWLVVSHGEKKDGDLGWRGYHLGNGDVTSQWGSSIVGHTKIICLSVNDLRI